MTATLGQFSQYAGIISAQAGVRVIARGSGFRTEWDGETATILIPSLGDNADPRTSEALFGFVLHEAAHVRFTDRNAVAEAKDGPTLLALNAFEDRRVNRRIAKAFPGAPRRIRRSVLWAMESRAIDAERWEPNLVDDKEAEMSRLLSAWTLLPLRVLPEETKGCLALHPWMPILLDVSTPPPDSTRQALAKARELIARLGIPSSPIGLPRDPMENAAKAAAREASKGAEAPNRPFRAFDRSLDRVIRIRPSPKAQTRMAAALRVAGPVACRALASLPRVARPSSFRLAPGRESGVPDPRSAWRIALAGQGLPVDASRCMAGLRMEPCAPVAACILVDCSSSMANPASKLALARCAALAVSRLLSSVGAAHEILGHTTSDVGIEETLGSLGGPDGAKEWGRVMPFRGLVFKSFRDQGLLPLFSGLQMRENLDGEAILWALGRLAARPEPRKALFVMTDSAPAAALSDPLELGRHLSLAVSRAEGMGVRTVGIGIGSPRVAEFFPRWILVSEAGDVPGAAVTAAKETLEGFGR